MIGVKKEMIDRLVEIQKAKDQNIDEVILEKINFPSDLYLVRLLELTDNPDFKDNRIIANYYNVNSIIVKH